MATLGGGVCSVILLSSGCVSNWSDLHRVCLEAEGDGREAGQDGPGYSGGMNRTPLHTHTNTRGHSFFKYGPGQSPPPLLCDPQVTERNAFSWWNTDEENI